MAKEKQVMVREPIENDIPKDKEVKLKQLLCKFLTADNAKTEAENDLKEIKELTLKAFKSLKIQSYSIDLKESVKKTKITFFRAKRTAVYYDIDKLKATLGKKKVDKILSKSYEISDYEMFKKVMKEYDVPSSELKGCIEVKESVDSNKLQRAFELDRIDLKEIKDCYTLATNEYVSIRRT